MAIRFQLKGFLPCVSDPSPYIVGGVFLSFILRTFPTPDLPPLIITANTFHGTYGLSRHIQNITYNNKI